MTTITAWINAKKYYVVPIAIYFDGTFEPSKIDFINGEGQLESAIKGEFILERSTGLKDKNGNEIFEGDIFKDEYNGGYEVVKYVNERAAFCLCWMNQERESEEFYTRDTTEMEIVGNIHENLELLGGK